MNNLQQNVNISKQEIEAFCQHHHIQKLAFFGSVLGNTFGPKSDVDVLVEFNREHIPGLVGFIGMEIELAKLFGRKVDLHTPQSLSRYFRDHVIAEAKIQYDA